MKNKVIISILSVWFVLLLVVLLVIATPAKAETQIRNYNGTILVKTDSSCFEWLQGVSPEAVPATWMTVDEAAKAKGWPDFVITDAALAKECGLLWQVATNKTYTTRPVYDSQDFATLTSKQRIKIGTVPVDARCNDFVKKYSATSKALEWRVVMASNGLVGVTVCKKQ